jgi:hypothetical protein
MDFMLGAAVAAVTNIGLLGALIFSHVQNLKLLRSYFTIGWIVVVSLFMVQNIVIVIFWFNLYLAGPEIKNVVDAAAPYLFFINLAQTGALVVLLWISRR